MNMKKLLFAAQIGLLVAALPMYAALELGRNHYDHTAKTGLRGNTEIKDPQIISLKPVVVTASSKTKAVKSLCSHKPSNPEEPIVTLTQAQLPEPAYDIIAAEETEAAVVPEAAGILKDNISNMIILTE